MIFEVSDFGSIWDFSHFTFMISVFQLSLKVYFEVHSVFLDSSLGKTFMKIYRVVRGSGQVTKLLIPVSLNPMGKFPQRTAK